MSVSGSGAFFEFEHISLERMKNEIKLQDRKIEYTLRVSGRARRLRLAVYGGGDFVVTAPRGMSRGLIERFIAQKSHWVLGKLDFFKRHPRLTLKGSRGDYRKYKVAARALVLARLRHLNSLYDFKFDRIFIRNQKTRWGSCSRRGNLSFNYKIALLAPRLADYLIVHELCHLGEFNHSKKFWALVKRAVPDYKELRKELRGNSLG